MKEMVGHPLFSSIACLKWVPEPLLTNAAGGIRNDLVAGDLMVVADHLNFIGSNPLIGTVPHPPLPAFLTNLRFRPFLSQKIHETGKTRARFEKVPISP